MTRRELLLRSGLLLGASGLNKILSARGQHQKWNISACDWSLGRSSDPGSFEIAKKIGLDGVQVNLGSVGNNMHMRSTEVQRSILDASQKNGIKISSLAIGELNNIPYKSDPSTEQWVWDSIDVANNLGVSVILLAFFHNNDLRNDDSGKKEVIRRLRKVAPKAEKQEVILGIESYLSAPELTDIIQKVGSKNVKVYYDFRNSADAGYDVVKEIKFLGKDAICELHMKENGHLLGKGTLDWRGIANALNEINYQGNGWMQIEGSVPEGADLIDSYKHNLRYLKQIFSVG